MPDNILDRERQANYRLLIKATDRGEPQLSSFIYQRIFLNDINDHPPIFDHLHSVISIQEGNHLFLPNT